MTAERLSELLDGQNKIIVIDPKEEYMHLAQALGLERLVIMDTGSINNKNGEVKHGFN